MSKLPNLGMAQWKTFFYIGILAYMVIWIFLSLMQQNYEFLFYLVALLILLAVIWKTDKAMNWSTISVGGFFAWTILHFLAGAWVIGDNVLYSTIIIPIVGEPYLILKFDQIMHFLCYMIVAWFMYDIAKHSCDVSKFGVLFILVLAACGIGTLNEILEFLAVVFIDNTGVGGYINNALDLVFNLFGAILGIILARKWIPTKS